MTQKHYLSAAIVAVIAILGLIWYMAQPGSEGGYDYANTTEDMIRLELIKPGNLVLPQFTATGEARGMWYFEGSFPAEVLDKDGTVIAQAQASAITDWMTEEFVPFRVTLDVGAYSGPATLVLKRDNPSGLPENDASISVPIEVFDVQ